MAEVVSRAHDAGQGVAAMWAFHGNMQLNQAIGPTKIEACYAKVSSACCRGLANLHRASVRKDIFPCKLLGEDRRQ